MTTAARLVAGIAVLHFLLALPSWASLEVLTGAGGASIVWIPLIALSFLGTGLFLLQSGRGDARAVHLSAVFAGVVAAFSARPAQIFVASLPGAWATAGDVLLALRVEAILPYFLWAFASGIPRARSPWDDWIGRVRRAVLTLGLGLLLLQLTDRVQPLGTTPAAVFLRSGDGRAYWIVLLLCALPALGALPVRMRAADRVERRRVRLLLAGVVVGGAPVVVLSLVDALVGIPETVGAATGWIVYPALASVPWSTAYAVLVDRALDVRLVVRRALQYALARYTLIAFGLVPLAAVGLVLFLNRERAVADLFFGPRSIILIAVSVFALGLLRVRHELMLAIDRRFFREQYDARQILGTVVRESREATSIPELERSLLRRVEASLHPRAAELLRARPGDAWLVSSADHGEPLAPGGPLVSALTRAGRAMSRGDAVDLADDAERTWLERRGMDLVVPLIGSDRDLLGILGLGPKRSELPYTSEDRALLAVACEAVALRLDGLTRSDTDRPGPEPTRATECTTCGAVQPADAGAVCRACGGGTVSALLPTVVVGKLGVIRRLGSGGGGRAYLAEDRSLGRRVALKVLRADGVGASIRLAREARALAAVSHPHVASVHALEEEAGRSVLVLEYLPGGTLANRLRSGPLQSEELAVLVDQLCRGLAHLHERGVLHRDLKPSNIGFTEEGDAKLLDFGQVSVGHSPAGEPAYELPGPMARAAGGVLPGTVAYMSPAALAGETPSPADDLWSLAVVVWESATGTHPFQRASIPSTIAGIVAASVTPWDSEHGRGYGALGRVLSRALSSEVERRFTSALEFNDAVQRALH